MFIFSLTEQPVIGYILNMFRATKRLSKSQETRYQILRTALGEERLADDLRAILPNPYGAAFSGYFAMPVFWS
jgi:hypothetical protein